MIKVTIFFPFVLVAFLMHMPASGQQVLLFTAENQEISANDSLAVYGHSSESLIKAEIFFHNNTDDDLHIWVRKHVHYVVPGTMNTFCWNGSCFAPDTYESPNAITLAPGETSTDTDFYAEYYPMDNEGVSIMAYEFFCAEETFAPVMATVVFVTRNSYCPPYVAFNPGDGSTDVAVDQEVFIVADQPVRHTDGTDISVNDLNDLIGFYADHEGGDPVVFAADINLAQTMITIRPVDPLHHATTYFVTLEALMGIDDQVSEPQSMTFTTEEATGIAMPDPDKVIIYPNPASETVYVSMPGNVDKMPIYLFDMGGKLLWTSTIAGNSAVLNLSFLHEGLYILAIEHPDGRIVRRVTIIP